MTEETPAARPRSSRYALLDPLRGLAASAVVLDHVAEVKIGYFAVLIFFVISGYCILASAESGLARRMTVGEYMLRRLRRIYPPYIASVVFFVITRIIKWHSTGDGAVFARPKIQWLQTLTLTQWLDLLPNVAGFPADGGALLVAAHWSLCYEEQFYFAVGLFMTACAFLVIPLRAVVLWFTAATTLFMAFFPQLCIGFFVDYWPLFGLGAIVYYATNGDVGERVRRALSAVPPVVLVVTAAVLLLHGRGIPTRRLVWQDLLMGSVVATVLVLARRFDARLAATAPVRLLAKVGTVSYSLYLIHQFNLNLMAKVAGRVVAREAWPFLNITLQLALHIALASAFWWAFERPFLNTRPDGEARRAELRPAT